MKVVVSTEINGETRDALVDTRDTLLDGWKAVYSTEATDNIKTSLGQ